MGVTFGEPIEALGHGMGTVTRETKEGKLRTARREKDPIQSC